jgi:ribokinase
VVGAGTDPPRSLPAPAAPPRPVPGTTSEHEGAAVDGPEQLEIVVVGSANVDLVVPVDTLPEPGQTVLGDDHLRAAGGKGANQAVAAARLGRAVAMVGRVGEDDDGRRLLASLEGSGVDVTNVLVTPVVPTGLALITVDRSGENTIAVSPGANARLAPADIAAAADLLRTAAVTLVQLEVPLDAVGTAVATAGGTVILNPAPATPLPPEVLAGVDVLVPNRSELGLLAGVAEPRSIQAAVEAACELPGGAAVVVTLGADGALVVDGDLVEHVPAVEVEAVDATGAGDAFCGGLADALARGLDLVEAVRWAVRVAGLATTAWGAQPSMPSQTEVEDRT